MQIRSFNVEICQFSLHEKKQHVFNVLESELCGISNFSVVALYTSSQKYSSSVKLLHVPFNSSNVGPANNSGVSVVTFSRFITKANKSNVVSVSSSNDSRGSCLLARLLIEKFIEKTQRALYATVRLSETDNGTETGVVRKDGKPKPLLEAARTMLIFAKAPLFLWAEAVATACYTLNRSLVHTLHGKTYYELLKGKKPNLQYFRVFGSLCYPTNDYDDVGKLKAKADIGIFVGYAPTKKAYRIYNKRYFGKIQETVHVAFDELTEGLTSVQTSSGLVPQQMTSVPNST
ncbi:retrovirus-related pol polyprotein from transposon TNT 1-94 [Tanacetum coccineum]